DEDGNYKYPEGFDPETNEWLEGYEAQREEWEQQYASAQQHWEEHKKQVTKAISADADAAASTSVSSESAPAANYASSEAPVTDAGTLASDEALAALREKLAGS
ncbi:MAG: 30S ribosomal protein S1, partial [Brevibacterium yomogidense]